MDAEQALEVPRVAIQLSRGYLTSSLQTDLSAAMLRRFREELAAKIQATEVKGMVVDLSGIAVLDSEDFAQLRKIIQMASLMGVYAIMTGLQPGVVSYLVESECDLSGLHTCLNLDEAVEALDHMFHGREKVAFANDDGEME